MKRTLLIFNINRQLPNYFEYKSKYPMMGPAQKQDVIPISMFSPQKPCSKWINNIGLADESDFKVLTLGQENTTEIIGEVCINDLPLLEPEKVKIIETKEEIYKHCFNAQELSLEESALSITKNGLTRLNEIQKKFESLKELSEHSQQLKVYANSIIKNHSLDLETTIHGALEEIDTLNLTTKQIFDHFQKYYNYIEESLDVVATIKVNYEIYSEALKQCEKNYHFTCKVNNTLYTKPELKKLVSSLRDLYELIESKQEFPIYEIALNSHRLILENIVTQAQKQLPLLVKISDELQPHVTAFKNKNLAAQFIFHHKPSVPTPTDIMYEANISTEILLFYKENVPALNFEPFLQRSGYSKRHIEAMPIKDLLDNLKSQILNHQLSFEDGKVLFEIIKIIKKHQHINYIANEFHYAIGTSPFGNLNKNTLSMNLMEPVCPLTPEDLNYLKPPQNRQKFFELISTFTPDNNLNLNLNTPSESVFTTIQGSNCQLEKHMHSMETTTTGITLIEGPFIGPFSSLSDILDQILINFYF